MLTADHGWMSSLVFSIWRGSSYIGPRVQQISFLKLEIMDPLLMKQHSGWHSIWGCHYMAQTGVIISPTQTMHYYNKGNPWKLPYICIVWSPKMGNWMTPVKRTRKSCCSDCPGCFSDFVLEVCTFALLVKQSGEPNSCESLLASPHLKKGCSIDIYLHVHVYIYIYMYICTSTFQIKGCHLNPREQRKRHPYHPCWSRSACFYLIYNMCTQLYTHVCLWCMSMYVYVSIYIYI